MIDITKDYKLWVLNWKLGHFIRSSLIYLSKQYWRNKLQKKVYLFIQKGRREWSKAKALVYKALQSFLQMFREIMKAEFFFIIIIMTEGIL